MIPDQTLLQTFNIDLQIILVSCSKTVIISHTLLLMDTLAVSTETDLSAEVSVIKAWQHTGATECKSLSKPVNQHVTWLVPVCVCSYCLRGYCSQIVSTISSLHYTDKDKKLHCHLKCVVVSLSLRFLEQQKPTGLRKKRKVNEIHPLTERTTFMSTFCFGKLDRHQSWNLKFQGLWLPYNPCDTISHVIYKVWNLFREITAYRTFWTTHSARISRATKISLRRKTDWEKGKRGRHRPEAMWQRRKTARHPGGSWW